MKSNHHTDIIDGDGRQIIVPGRENFGKGSFDFENRTHRIPLGPLSIIPIKWTVISQDITSRNMDAKVIRTVTGTPEYGTGCTIYTCDN
jgi:hypothetical protein